MILVRLPPTLPNAALRAVERFYDDDARCYSNDRPDQYGAIDFWLLDLAKRDDRHVWLAYTAPPTDATQKLVGIGGLRDYGEPATAELFVVVDPKVRDRGVGTEIVRKLLVEGHRLYHRVEARVDVANARGLVCMMQAGMHLEGVQRGLAHDRPGGTRHFRDYHLLSHLRGET